MKIFRACLLIPILLVVLLSIRLAARKTDFQRTCLQVGNETIEAMVAKTAKELENGLSVVDGLKDGQGMLFVFEKGARPIFHLGRVSSPLSIAFVNEKGKILKIENMVPKKGDPLYVVPERIRYALEVPFGWFEKNRVKAGSRIKGNRKILKDGETCFREGIA